MSLSRTSATRVFSIASSTFLARADDGTPNITLSGSIAANGYYLLERTDDNAVSDIPADQIYTGASVNSGETLRLTDTLSSSIDSVNADGGGWPAGSPSSTYYSMERIDALSGGDDANWASNDGVTRNGLDANPNALNATLVVSWWIGFGGVLRCTYGVL